jgi:hypothetical protein
MCGSVGRSRLLSLFCSLGRRDRSCAGSTGPDVARNMACLVKPQRASHGGSSASGQSLPLFASGVAKDEAAVRQLAAGHIHVLASDLARLQAIAGEHPHLQLGYGELLGADL